MKRKQITPTKAQMALLPKLYATEKVKTADKVAVLKFFDCAGRGTWYAVEGEEQNGDLLCFGWVASPLGSDCDEWGYFSFNELASVTNRLGLPLERDTHFQPTKLSEILKQHGH